jgi:hypothetical protein
MDIHLTPRQRQVIRFALCFLEENIDDVKDMLEEAPSEIVGSFIDYGEARDIEEMLNPHFNEKLKG